MKFLETDVVVIGGGATGAGILRDLALRGIACILVEKGDLTHGTSGRNHGLLHSGGRYAVKDTESAEECIRENKILKNIARHCIEDTGGLFVSLPDDPAQYEDDFLKGCARAGIDAQRISRQKAFELEPALNPLIRTAVRVPDGTIDPFRLVAANTLDARLHGATILTYHQVTAINKTDNRITGIICKDADGKEKKISCRVVINAAGVWSAAICAMAGAKMDMSPSGGAMIIADYRINRMVVNRLRMPANGDIIVPGDTVSIIGTTSRKVTFEEIETNTVSSEEVQELIREGAALIPGIKKARLLRAYAGVRPLVSSGKGDGRNISRGIVLVDHEKEHGLKGFITITGGKLMTYRLMAELASDICCQKLDIRTQCTTGERPLPGSEKKISPGELTAAAARSGTVITGSTIGRHGSSALPFLSTGDTRPLCECEMVSRAEMEYAIDHLDAKNLGGLRRRTRMGMGPCQGTYCTYRSAGIFLRKNHDISAVEADIIHFTEERWKGVQFVLGGDTLREAEFTQWVKKSLLGLTDV